MSGYPIPQRIRHKHTHKYDNDNNYNCSCPSVIPSWSMDGNINFKCSTRGRDGIDAAARIELKFEISKVITTILGLQDPRGCEISGAKNWLPETTVIGCTCNLQRGGVFCFWRWCGCGSGRGSGLVLIGLPPHGHCGCSGFVAVFSIIVIILRRAKSAC